MATRGLRWRGRVGQPRSRQPCPGSQGTPDPLSRATSARMPAPAPALAFRRQPVPPVGLAASRRGSWLDLAADPLARPSVHPSVSLRPLTGSITRTIQRLRRPSDKGKRPTRNPEVVPTKVGAVPSPLGFFPSAGPRRPQAVPSGQPLADRGVVPPAGESDGPWSTVTSATFHRPDTWAIVRTIRKTSVWGEVSLSLAYSWSTTP